MRFLNSLVAGALAAALLSTAALADQRTGTGGTAIFPVLQVGVQKYAAKTGDQAIRTGGGIQQIEASRAQTLKVTP